MSGERHAERQVNNSRSDIQAVLYMCTERTSTGTEVMAHVDGADKEVPE